MSDSNLEKLAYKYYKEDKDPYPESRAQNHWDKAVEVKKKWDEFEENFFKIKVGLGLSLSGLTFIPSISTCEFLYQFITNYNYKFNTVNGDFVEKKDSAGNITKVLRVITYTGRRRSLIETFALIKSYYPDYTLKQFICDLYKVIEKVWDEKGDKNKILSLHYCGDVRRAVIYYCGIQYLQEKYFYEERPTDPLTNIQFMWKRYPSSYTKTEPPIEYTTSSKILDGMDSKEIYDWANL